MDGIPITPYKGRNADEIIAATLAMYEDGIEVADAAKRLDVPARTIHRWLITNATDQWQELQRARVMADYEAARLTRKTANDTLDALRRTLDAEGVTDGAERNWRLAHIREVLRAADTGLQHQQWLLERLLRRIYGNDKIVMQINNISVDDTLGLQAAGLLDKLKCVSVVPDAAPQHTALQHNELVGTIAESEA